jgi:hypothetical protein
MKQIFFYIIVLLAVVNQYACKKDLNALPLQAKVEGNVVVDQKSAEVAMNGAYARLGITGTSLSVQSTTYAIYHEVYPALFAGTMQYAFGQLTEQVNIVSPASSATLWTPKYALLNAANGVIEGVTDLADSKFTGTRKIEMLAEARFLRAYGHYGLLAYYGEWYKIGSPYGVMLRKQSLKLSNGAQPRSSVKETYDYILQDLDYAIANAADNRPNYYVNKTAAKALKIRVLMLRGQAADYMAITTLADEIIANTAYSLEPNLKDLMQVKGLTSKEVILGITPFPSQVGRKANYEYVQSSAFLSTPFFRKMIENDPRKSWMLTKATASPVVSIRDSIYFSKYAGLKVEDSYVLRLTETYLMKAEALMRSGGSIADAKTILKTVMAKAGVTDFTEVDNASTSAQVLVEIYKEYVRNMSCEDGIEWFALLRLPFDTIKQFKPTILSQNQYILPIPAAEFQLNPTIGDQNPGYLKL